MSDLLWKGANAVQRMVTRRRIRELIREGMTPAQVAARYGIENPDIFRKVIEDLLGKQETAAWYRATSA